MFPDSTSRSIFGWSVVAVILLATWLHGHGKGAEHQAASRCEPGITPPVDVRGCKNCQDAARAIDDVRPRATRIVTTAPRA